MKYDRIGPYKILGRLGGGGMGTVYRARHRQSGQVVALKVLREDLLEDDTYLQRFRREAQIAKSLDSRNVVRVLDVGLEGYLPYIAMELVEGESLSARLKREERLTPEEAAGIGCQVASGLCAGEQAGIVHRDISPQNILIASDGTVKIADFGIARSQTTATLTATSAFLGKPSYAAPEMFEGKADGRSDIYSLGAVMFEMVAGRPPFVALSPFAVMGMHASQTPPALSAFSVDAPDVEVILRKCLAKTPDQRYQTARELLRDLTAALPADSDETMMIPASPHAPPSGTGVGAGKGGGGLRNFVGTLGPAWRPGRPLVLGTGVLGVSIFLGAAVFMVLAKDGGNLDETVVAPRPPTATGTVTPAATTQTVTATPTDPPVVSAVGDACASQLPADAASFAMPSDPAQVALVQALNCLNAVFIEASETAGTGKLTTIMTGAALTCYGYRFADMRLQHRTEIDRPTNLSVTDLQMAEQSAVVRTEETWTFDPSNGGGSETTYEKNYDFVRAGDRWVAETNTYYQPGQPDESCGGGAIEVGRQAIVADTEESSGNPPQAKRLALRTEPRPDAEDGRMWLQELTLVTVVDGPVDSAGYRWWKIQVVDTAHTAKDAKDDEAQAGSVGWSAQASKEGMEWLVPAAK